MKGLFIRWIISAIALWITSRLAVALGNALNTENLDIVVEGALPALIAVAALAIINALIRPLVIVMTLPLNCLTLGLFTLVINILMFWLASAIVPGFRVNGFLAALFGSIVMGIISGLANSIIAPPKER